MSDEPEITVHDDDEAPIHEEIFDRPFCYATIRKLRAEIDATDDPAKAAFHCYAIGWIFERHLHDAQQAATHYKEALSKDPELLPALRAVRRRSLKQGNWSRYIELSDAEIALTRKLPLRSQLRVEKAEVLDTQLDEPTIALTELEKALEEDPDNMQALWCLENLHRSRRNLEELAETLTRIASALDDGPLKLNLRYEAARIAEVGLEDPVEAAVQYEAIVGGDDLEPRARMALRMLYNKSGDLNKLVDDLRLEASGLTGRERARVLYTIARILNDRLGELVEAISALELALEADPDSSLVIAELVRLYPLVGKLGRLAHCYREQIRLTSDNKEKGSLYHRLGLLYDEELKEEDLAEECLWKALEYDSENHPALASLAVFYQKRDRTEDLVALHLDEAESTESPLRSALAFHRGAEILEAQEEDERAKNLYIRALEAMPAFVPSFNALEQLLERMGDHVKLVELLKDRADREDNPFIKNRLIERTARIIEERLADKEGAIGAYAEILEIDPTSRTAVGALVRLTRELELWDDQVKYLVFEADLSEDDQQVVAILLRVGEIQENRLDDEDAAIETYQRLMSVDPFYPPAIRNLGRLYFRRGMFEELINLHRQELDITTEADEKSLLHYKIGKIFENKLDDLDESSGAFKAAILENPRNFAASWALYRIFLKREDWLGIIDILEGEANALPDGAQRAMALVRVGELWEEPLDRIDMATDAYMQALRVHPGCREAREALIRLSEHDANWEYLADLLYQEFQTAVDPDEQYRLALQLGDLSLERTNNPRKAMEWYMKALGLKPESVAALRGTEHALRAGGEWQSFLDVRRKLIGLTNNEQTRLALFHGVEMLDHLHARSIKKGHKEPLVHVDDLDLSSDGPLVDLMLEREVVEHGDPGARLRYYESRIESGNTPMSLQLADGFDRADALIAAGMTDDALEVLEKISKEDSASLLALLFVEHVAQKSGDEARVVAASTRLGDTFERPAFKAESLLRRGMARLESSDDRKAGLTDLQEALELDPDSAEAFSAIVQAMGTEGRWADLVALIEAHVDKVKSPERSVEVFGTLGSLQWRRLENPTAAIKSYNRVLKHDAKHAPTLMNLVDLYVEQDQENEAIAVCQHLISMSPDQSAFVEASVKLADLLDKADRDTTEVIGALEGIVERDPENRDVLERLARLHRRNNDTEAALSTIDKLSSTEQDPERKAALLTDQAELMRKTEGESDDVIDLLCKAVAVHPSAERTLTLLIDMMEKLERFDELTKRIANQLDRIDEDEFQIRAMLLTRLSNIYREHLGDEEKAAVTLRQAFDLDPSCGDTGRLLIEGLVASDRFGDAAEVCERMLADDPICYEAYPSIVSVLQELGQKTRAGLVAQVPYYFGLEDDLIARMATELRSARADHTPTTIKDDDMALIRADLVDHPALSILEILGLAGSKVMGRELSDYGLEKGDKLTGKSEQGKLLVTECARAAKLLGVKDYEVYLIPSQGAEVTVETHKTPSLLFSVIVTELSELEQRFLAVQALCQVKFNIAPALKLKATELEELFMAVARLFDPQFGSDATGLRRVEEFQSGLESAITKKQRKALEPLVTRYTEGQWIDFEEWHHDMHVSAIRLALLATGDAGAVLDAIKKRDPVLIGVPLTKPQSRREGFTKSDTALDAIRFLLDPDTVALWEKYSAKL